VDAGSALFADDVKGLGHVLAFVALDRRQLRALAARASEQDAQCCLRRASAAQELGGEVKVNLKMGRQNERPLEAAADGRQAV
jgi:hypothetical protein